MIESSGSSQGATPSRGSTGTAPEAERRVPWWRGRSRLLVVPMDGSAAAKVALLAARHIARIADATIVVVHVTDEPQLAPPDLLASVGLLPEESDGLTVESASGDRAAAIVGLAERRHAMLIVMATRGGTTATTQVSPLIESVLDGAPSPVLLVSPGLAGQLAEWRQPRRLLLPLDGTPSAAAALGPALDLAERLEAEVDVLNVAGQVEAPRESGSLSAPLYIDQPQHEWPAWAREFAERFGTALGQRSLPAKARVFVRSGEPAEEIVRFAEERESDLIVLQWRSGGQRERGQVVSEILARMPCPVLLHSAEAPEPLPGAVVQSSDWPARRQ